VLSLTGARTWHDLNPFVGAGAGLTWDLAGISLIETELEEADRFDMGAAFATEVGGGVRWFATDIVTVRVDLGLHLWRLKAPDGFRDPERGFGDVGESEWASARSVTLGVGYRF
jgi:hypothetical protein